MEYNEEIDATLRSLEEKYVHNVYDAIAPHFHSTRFAIWPKVIISEKSASTE